MEEWHSTPRGSERASHEIRPPATNAGNNDARAAETKLQTATTANSLPLQHDAFAGGASDIVGVPAPMSRHLERHVEPGTAWQYAAHGHGGHHHRASSMGVAARSSGGHARSVRIRSVSPVVLGHAGSFSSHAVPHDNRARLGMQQPEALSPGFDGLAGLFAMRDRVGVLAAGLGGVVSESVRGGHGVTPGYSRVTPGTSPAHVTRTLSQDDLRKARYLAAGADIADAAIEAAAAAIERDAENSRAQVRARAGSDGPDGSGKTAQEQLAGYGGAATGPHRSSPVRGPPSRQSSGQGYSIHSVRTASPGHGRSNSRGGRPGEERAAVGHAGDAHGHVEGLLDHHQHVGSLPEAQDGYVHDEEQEEEDGRDGSDARRRTGVHGLGERHVHSLSLSLSSRDDSGSSGRSTGGMDSRGLHSHSPGLFNTGSGDGQGAGHRAGAAQPSHSTAGAAAHRIAGLPARRRPSDGPVSPSSPHSPTKRPGPARADEWGRALVLEAGATHADAAYRHGHDHTVPDAHWQGRAPHTGVDSHGHGHSHSHDLGHEDSYPTTDDESAPSSALSHPMPGLGSFGLLGHAAMGCGRVVHGHSAALSPGADSIASPGGAVSMGAGSTDGTGDRTGQVPGAFAASRHGHVRDASGATGAMSSSTNSSSARSFALDQRGGFSDSGWDGAGAEASPGGAASEASDGPSTLSSVSSLSSPFGRYAVGQPQGQPVQQSTVLYSAHEADDEGGVERRDLSALDATDGATGEADGSGQRATDISLPVATATGSASASGAAATDNNPAAVPLTLEQLQAAAATRRLRQAPKERVPIEPLGSKDPRWDKAGKGNTCAECGGKFSLLYRRHHCRGCGTLLCAECTPYQGGDMKRVCKKCNALRQGRVLRDPGSKQDTLHFLDAVACGDVLEVETRLAQGADVNAVEGSDGLSALHIAAGYPAYAEHRAQVAHAMACRLAGEEGDELRRAAALLPPGPLQRAAMGQLHISAGPAAAVHGTGTGAGSQTGRGAAGAARAAAAAPSAAEVYTNHVILQAAASAASAALASLHDSRHIRQTEGSRQEEDITAAEAGQAAAAGHVDGDPVTADVPMPQLALAGAAGQAMEPVSAPGSARSGTDGRSGSRSGSFDLAGISPAQTHGQSLPGSSWASPRLSGLRASPVPFHATPGQGGQAHGHGVTLGASGNAHGHGTAGAGGPPVLSPLLSSLGSLVSAAAGKLSSLNLGAAAAATTAAAASAVSGMVATAAGAIAEGLVEGLVANAGGMDSMEYGHTTGQGPGGHQHHGGQSPASAGAHASGHTAHGHGTSTTTPPKGSKAHAAGGHGQHGASAVHPAVEQTALALVQTLLDGGAEVNQTTASGRTPLHMAALHGTVAIVQMLLDAGALQGHADKNGLTPHDYAALRAARGDAEGQELLSVLDARYSTGLVAAHARLTAAMAPTPAAVPATIADAAPPAVEPQQQSTSPSTAAVPRPPSGGLITPPGHGSSSPAAVKLPARTIQTLSGNDMLAHSGSGDHKGGHSASETEGHGSSRGSHGPYHEGTNPTAAGVQASEITDVLHAAGSFSRAEALPLPAPSQMYAAGFAHLDPSAAALQANLLAVRNGYERWLHEHAWMDTFEVPALETPLGPDAGLYASSSSAAGMIKSRSSATPSEDIHRPLASTSFRPSQRTKAAQLGLLPLSSVHASGLAGSSRGQDREGWGDRELALVGAVWRVAHLEAGDADLTVAVEQSFKRRLGQAYAPPAGIASQLASIQSGKTDASGSGTDGPASVTAGGSNGGDSAGDDTGVHLSNSSPQDQVEDEDDGASFIRRTKHGHAVSVPVSVPVPVAFPLALPIATVAGTALAAVSGEAALVISGPVDGHAGPAHDETAAASSAVLSVTSPGRGPASPSPLSPGQASSSPVPTLRNATLQRSSSGAQLVLHTDLASFLQTADGQAEAGYDDEQAAEAEVVPAADLDSQPSTAGQPAVQPTVSPKLDMSGTKHEQGLTEASPTSAAHQAAAAGQTSPGGCICHGHAAQPLPNARSATASDAADGCGCGYNCKRSPSACGSGASVAPAPASTGTRSAAAATAAAAPFETCAGRDVHGEPCHRRAEVSTGFCHVHATQAFLRCDVIVTLPATPTSPGDDEGDGTARGADDGRGGGDDGDGEECADISPPLAVVTARQLRSDGNKDDSTGAGQGTGRWDEDRLLRYLAQEHGVSVQSVSVAPRCPNQPQTSPRHGSGHAARQVGLVLDRARHPTTTVPSVVSRLVASSAVAGGLYVLGRPLTKPTFERVNPAAGLTASSCACCTACVGTDGSGTAMPCCCNDGKGCGNSNGVGACGDARPGPLRIGVKASSDAAAAAPDRGGIPGLAPLSIRSSTRAAQASPDHAAPSVPEGFAPSASQRRVSLTIRADHGAATPHGAGADPTASGRGEGLALSSAGAAAWRGTEPALREAGTLRIGNNEDLAHERARILQRDVEREHEEAFGLPIDQLRATLVAPLVAYLEQAHLEAAQMELQTTLMAASQELASQQLAAAAATGASVAGGVNDAAVPGQALPGDGLQTTVDAGPVPIGMALPLASNAAPGLTAAVPIASVVQAESTTSTTGLAPARPAVSSLERPVVPRGTLQIDPALMFNFRVPGTGAPIQLQLAQTVPGGLVASNPSSTCTTPTAAGATGAGPWDASAAGAAVGVHPERLPQAPVLDTRDSTGSGSGSIRGLPAGSPISAGSVSGAAIGSVSGIGALGPMYSPGLHALGVHATGLLGESYLAEPTHGPGPVSGAGVGLGQGQGVTLLSATASANASIGQSSGTGSGAHSGLQSTVQSGVSSALVSPSATPSHGTPMLAPTQVLKSCLKRTNSLLVSGLSSGLLGPAALSVAAAAAAGVHPEGLPSAIPMAMSTSPGLGPGQSYGAASQVTPSGYLQPQSALFAQGVFPPRDQRTSSHSSYCPANASSDVAPRTFFAPGQVMVNGQASAAGSTTTMAGGDVTVASNPFSAQSSLASSRASSFASLRSDCEGAVGAVGPIQAGGHASNSFGQAVGIAGTIGASTGLNTSFGSQVSISSYGSTGLLIGSGHGLPPAFVNGSGHGLFPAALLNAPGNGSGNATGMSMGQGRPTFGSMAFTAHGPVMADHSLLMPGGSFGIARAGSGFSSYPTGPGMPPAGPAAVPVPTATLGRVGQLQGSEGIGLGISMGSVPQDSPPMSGGHLPQGSPGQLPQGSPGLAGAGVLPVGSLPFGALSSPHMIAAAAQISAALGTAALAALEARARSSSVNTTKSGLRRSVSFADAGAEASLSRRGSPTLEAQVHGQDYGLGHGLQTHHHGHGLTPTAAGHHYPASSPDLLSLPAPRLSGDAAGSGIAGMTIAAATGAQPLLGLSLAHAPTAHAPAVAPVAGRVPADIPESGETPMATPSATPLGHALHQHPMTPMRFGDATAAVAGSDSKRSLVLSTPVDGVSSAGTSTVLPGQDSKDKDGSGFFFGDATAPADSPAGLSPAVGPVVAAAVSAAVTAAGAGAPVIVNGSVSWPGVTVGPVPVAMPAAGAEAQSGRGRVQAFALAAPPRPIGAVGPALGRTLSLGGTKPRRRGGSPFAHSGTMTTRAEDAASSDDDSDDSDNTGGGPNSSRGQFSTRGRPLGLAIAAAGRDRSERNDGDSDHDADASQGTERPAVQVAPLPDPALWRTGSNGSLKAHAAPAPVTPLIGVATALPVRLSRRPRTPPVPHGVGRIRSAHDIDGSDDEEDDEEEEDRNNDNGDAVDSQDDIDGADDDDDSDSGAAAPRATAQSSSGHGHGHGGVAALSAVRSGVPPIVPGFTAVPPLTAGLAIKAPAAPPAAPASAAPPASSLAPVAPAGSAAPAPLGLSLSAVPRPGLSIGSGTGMGIDTITGTTTGMGMGASMGLGLSLRRHHQEDLSDDGGHDGGGHSDGHEGTAVVAPKHLAPARPTQSQRQDGINEGLTIGRLPSNGSLGKPDSLSSSSAISGAPPGLRRIGSLHSGGSASGGSSRSLSTAGSVSTVDGSGSLSLRIPSISSTGSGSGGARDGSHGSGRSERQGKARHSGRKHRLNSAAGDRLSTGTQSADQSEDGSDSVDDDQEEMSQRSGSVRTGGSIRTGGTMSSVRSRTTSSDGASEASLSGASSSSDSEDGAAAAPKARGGQGCTPLVRPLSAQQLAALQASLGGPGRSVGGRVEPVGVTPLIPSVTSLIPPVMNTAQAKVHPQLVAQSQQQQQPPSVYQQQAPYQYQQPQLKLAGQPPHLPSIGAAVAGYCGVGDDDDDLEE